MEVNGRLEEEAVDEDSEPEMELSKVIHLCKQMECISIKYGAIDTSLDLSWGIRKLRIELRQMESAQLKQTTLEQWFRGQGQ